MTISFENRREKLRAKMADKGLAALIVSHPSNRYYLSGFEPHDAQCDESSGWLLVTNSGRDVIMTDPRYLDSTRRFWPEADIFIYSGKRDEKVAEFIAGLNLSGSIGFEEKYATVETHKNLSSHLASRLHLVPAQGMVEELRVRKDAAELELLRQSCALNHAVMQATPGLMREGMTERELAWEIEKLFRQGGASKLAFSPIVAVNRNAALPHAVPGETRLTENCMVLVDVGGRLNEYNSDQTRTFWFGPTPSDRFKTALARVQEAQAAALAVIRPGLPAKDAYLAARAVFETHGVAEFFTHSLGHGVGLQTHEAPGLGPVSPAVLEPGMVITVEPGLYWADWGGIRWEYMAVVTEDGVETF